MALYFMQTKLKVGHNFLRSHETVNKQLFIWDLNSTQENNTQILHDLLNTVNFYLQPRPSQVNFKDHKISLSYNEQRYTPQIMDPLQYFSGIDKKSTYLQIRSICLSQKTYCHDLFGGVHDEMVFDVILEWGASTICP